MAPVTDPGLVAAAILEHTRDGGAGAAHPERRSIAAQHQFQEREVNHGHLAT
jgi:hypothetical protein